ncbi:MalY/PatB family protein [Micromonospora sp. NPDC051925]|uniref:MalY/PatB family protein n=1 Tax=Micromonospora sp. NPDC051925 TaxID=3364288 RepID=UPI0037C6300D
MRDDTTGHASSPFERTAPNLLRRRRSLKWRDVDSDVLSLWVAEMDTPLAPSILRALQEAAVLGDTGYAAPGGLPEAFAGFASRRYGWRPEPSDLVLVADIMAGVDVALKTLTRPGDPVVVSTPVYGPFMHHVDYLGRRVVSSPLRHEAGVYHFDPDRLAADFAAGAKAYILCNPHNPTGLVHTREELETIGRLADHYGVTVIADEVHAPLTMPGVRHVPFASVDAEAAARGFSAHSASKAWNLAGLKAAILVPGPDADRVEIRQELAVGASLWGVLASEAAFRDGQDWLDEIRVGISERSALLSELLADHLPKIQFQPPSATYLAWLDMRAYGLGDDPALFVAERSRVALYGGPYFGAEGRGFARLNLATSRAVLTEAVHRMARTLR